MTDTLTDPHDHPDPHSYKWSQAEMDYINRRVAAAVLREREECAEKAGAFAQHWWAIHCASNKHMDTTRKAHDDFCALQIAIRAGGNKA